MELAPSYVEKHFAIRADLPERQVSDIAVVGDSFNDSHLLEMAQQQLERITACLVFRRETAAPLLNLVDVLAAGEANVAAFIDLVIEAKNRRLQSL